MKPFVFFDVGGTLLHFKPSLPVLVGRACRSLGLEVDDTRSAGLFKTAMIDAGEGPDSVDLARNAAWWRSVYSSYLTAIESPHPTVHLDTLWRLHRTGEWLEPSDDTATTLEALKIAGYRLGIISNWDDTLDAILARRSLDAFFEVIVASSSIGAKKPDRRIFDHALELAGVDAADAVHIGDDPICDVVGAARAGLVPVLFGDPRTISNPSVHSISTLEELIGHSILENRRA